MEQILDFGLTMAGFKAYFKSFAYDYFIVVPKVLILAIWHITKLVFKLGIRAIAFFHTGRRLRWLLSISIIYFTIKFTGVSSALYAILSSLY